MASQVRRRRRGSVSSEPVEITLPDGRTAFSQVARGLWGMRLHFVLYDPELDRSPVPDGDRGRDRDPSYRCDQGLRHDAGQSQGSNRSRTPSRLAADDARTPSRSTTDEARTRSRSTTDDARTPSRSTTDEARTRSKSTTDDAPARPTLTVMDCLRQPKPTVLFLHGFQSDWQAWKHVLSRLGPEYRAIALDLPGHGRSAKPLTTYTMPFYARAVASFLLYLRQLSTRSDGLASSAGPSGSGEPSGSGGPIRSSGPSGPSGPSDQAPAASFTLVGVSMGGIIATRTALNYPSLVQRLVLVDSAGIGPRPQSLSSRWRFVPMLFWQLLGRPRAETIRTAYESSLMCRPERVSDLLVNDAIATQQACRLASLLNGITLSLPSARAFAQLQQVSQPTLLVWGRHDRVFPVTDADAAQARIPHAQLVVLEDCGHVPMQEQPEALAQVLRRFLEENEQATDLR